MKRVYTPCPQPEEAKKQKPTGRTASERSVEILQTILKEGEPCDICKDIKSKTCEHKSCPICLEVLVTNDIVLLSCNHIFCRGCIKDWISNNKDSLHVPCPVCRAPVTKYHYVDESRKDSIATVHVRGKGLTLVNDPSLHRIRYVAGDRIDRILDGGDVEDIDDDDDDDDDEAVEPPVDHTGSAARDEAYQMLAFAAMLQRYTRARMNGTTAPMPTPTAPTRQSPRRRTVVMAAASGTVVIVDDEDEE